jgi:clan AA aspartic protease
MGLTYTNLTLINPRDAKSLTVRALADTGALHLCIPEYIASQLKLQEVEKREVTIANGAKISCAYVGPVELKFANRSCFTGAMVIGDEVLFGVIPMEDMDLVVNPSTQTVDVNPESPERACSKIKLAH